MTNARRVLGPGKLQKNDITRDDEELIDRLRKIGTLIDDLPVWPFDARTVRKFLTAYVAPLLGSFSYPLIRMVVVLVSARFPV